MYKNARRGELTFIILATYSEIQPNSQKNNADSKARGQKAKFRHTHGVNLTSAFLFVQEKGANGLGGEDQRTPIEKDLPNNGPSPNAGISSLSFDPLYSI